MFEITNPLSEFISEAEYRDKVAGCWAGKNIGGTLGGPFEGVREMLDLDFYRPVPSGEPLPNDDLDLQLLWLIAVETHGVFAVNERVLGEAFLRGVAAPWNEYGIARANLANGFAPPLSGALGNRQWQNSNGAWIRSEIWACLFPGDPDEAGLKAWQDACIDHTGEGVYAEIFTAALEAGAFVENDLPRLLDLARARIPDECRCAAAIDLARREFAQGTPWHEARERIVAECRDTGFFQAPQNLGFVALGLLYGQGDFSQSICIAANCGDDTDCTAATVGAVMGILGGRSGIPERWLSPIGNKINTIAVHRFGQALPATLDELAARILNCKRQIDLACPGTLRLGGATAISETYRQKMCETQNFRARLQETDSWRQSFPLPYGGILHVGYPDGAEVAAGENIRFKITIEACPWDCVTMFVAWELPDGWSVASCPESTLLIRCDYRNSTEFTLTAGALPSAFTYLRLRVTRSDRPSPLYLTVPIAARGALHSTLRIPEDVSLPFRDEALREQLRRQSSR